jgi:hypothetical protein
MLASESGGDERLVLWLFAARTEDPTSIWTAKLFMTLAFPVMLRGSKTLCRRRYAARGFWGKKQGITL